MHNITPATIGLIDFDSKIPNMALMKISAWYKSQGCQVRFNNFSASEVDKVFCSVVFPKNKRPAELLRGLYGDRIQFGGTGYDLTIKLPREIESMRPDYNLYTADFIYSRICRGIGKKETKYAKAQTLIDAGIGRLSEGCPNTCSFCVVPIKEPEFKRVAEIGDLLNPRSNVLVFLDNNILALPDIISILQEIRHRGLIVDFAQGIDARLVTEEIAFELGKIRHLRSLPFAWDLIGAEKSIRNGIAILTRHVKAGKLMCFTLTGFNTSFEEDQYRINVLDSLKIDPFVMRYDRCNDPKIRHYARYINSRIYKVCRDFEHYEPWAKIRDQYTVEGLGMMTF